MATISSNPTPPPYQRPRPLSALQTLLWLVAGIAGMFALVSSIFAVKLGLEGRLPFTDESAPPPPTAATAALAAERVRHAQASVFVSGSENILPPEVSHLAKAPSALDEANASADAPTPPIPASVTATPPAPQPAPAVSVAAQPVTKPTPPAQQPTADTQAISQALDSWASAWSRKDVDGYLAHYADEFVPSGGLDRNTWIAQRQQRLQRPGNIHVSFDKPDIQTHEGRATARFIQHYQSDKLKLSETKTLELANTKGHWLIVAERVGD